MTHWPATLFLTLFVVGCDRGQPVQTALPEFASERMALWPQHSYFPLTPGTVRIFEGDEDGHHLREEIVIQGDSEILWGTLCAVMTERIYLDHQLTEVTSSWYGLDLDGNVWKFGEQSHELKGEEFVRSSDSWIAGVAGAMPSVALAARPVVGDVYTQPRPDGGQDTYEVVALNATATVASGTYENCLQIVENPDDPDDQDIILYAPGMGKVSEQGSSGRLELVTTGREGPPLELPRSRPAITPGTILFRRR